MRETTERKQRRECEAGHALVLATIVVVTLMAFGFTMVRVVTSAKEENSTARDQLKRLYLAESGLQAAILDLKAGGTGTLGSDTAAISFGDGGFWTVTTDNGDGSYTVRASSLYSGGRRVLQGLVREQDQVFHHAVFAGNSSEDPTYVMDFGGSGGQADSIAGNIYSGGDINVWGDATITGTAIANGSISGAGGTTGVVQSGFDFSATTFAGPDIVDVAGEFTALGVPQADDAGGTADQLPESHPAHIFRKNPDDRTVETGGTTKDDFFLEDPYEVVRTDLGGDGTDAYVISADDGTGGVSRTYYIDGNLWIHNRPTLSFIIESAGTGTQLTFIVRGNITFSDSVFLQSEANDGLAFIALKDAAVPDSGNIYLGDPTGGTLSDLHGFLYAENDFLDINLSADGSSTVHLTGAMTAGNHVAIERTFGTEHSKLTVDWDPRLKSGDLTLPRIPSQRPDNAYWLEAWVEVSPNSL